jgi:hypothetical protein
MGHRVKPHLFSGLPSLGESQPDHRRYILVGMKPDCKFLLTLACFLAIYGRSPAQSPVSQQYLPAAVPTNIHQLFLDDQAERTVRGFAPKYGPDVNSRDAMRRAEAKSLLAAGELKTAQDFHDAAFIFQHGHDPDDYLLAHILAIEAIAKGDASSKWIAAATLDRYLQSIGQKQVFGTQYTSESYLFLQQHKDDPNAKNSPEAQQKGYTQEPFDRNLVPDALRGDFCIPNQGTQESGKAVTSKLPPGCSN